MKTKYYCKKCDIQIEEEGMPNINKRHRCGEFLRIKSLEEAETGEEE